MNKRLLGLVPLFALTCSCVQNKARLDLDKYPFAEDGVGYLFRNGDNYTKEGIAYSYNELTRRQNFALIQTAVEHEADVLLFLHQNNCPSCQASHDNLATFYMQSGVEAYSYDFTSFPSEVLAELNRLPGTYPAYAETMKRYVTPSLYLLKGTSKALYLDFLPAQKEGLSSLESYFKNLLNLTYVFTFRDYGAFVSFAKDHEVLAVKASEYGFFYDEVYPLAKRSGHFTALLEYDLMDQGNKTRCDAAFEEADIALFQTGSIKRKERVQEDLGPAKELIKEYYA